MALVVEDVVEGDEVGAMVGGCGDLRCEFGQHAAILSYNNAVRQWSAAGYSAELGRAMQRRNFVSLPLLAAPLAGASGERRVFAYGDGIPHSPTEYSALLARLTQAPKFAADVYSLGGVVEELEQRMAAMLGKESAVWMPTGTLANHMAVRLLAGNRRRVLVQAESHLFNDCGDCAQTLSQMHLVPLGAGRATFRLAEAEQALADAMSGRVETPVGAIQIETPVRRRRGESFEFAEMEKISAWARGKGIGMHLDGARLFLECAYTRRSVKDYAALFDTVYVSQYKYFNAAGGAILAGPKALLANLFHARRMFGGAVHEAWPNAAVALHYLDSFEGRLRTAVDNAEKVLARLPVERVANGTNIARLKTPVTEAQVKRMAAAGVMMRAGGTIQVNETWARQSVDELVKAFESS